MPSAKVVNISPHVTLRALDANGDWRDLAEGDEIANAEQIRARASGPQFGLDAYILQVKTDGVWTNSLVMTMDARSGSGNVRQDKFGVTGTEDDGAIAILVTLQKGHLWVQDALLAQAAAEAAEGDVFTYQNEEWAGVFSEVDRSDELGRGGFEETVIAELIANREQFALAEVDLTLGQQILFQGQRYRILKIGKSDAVFAIGLGSVNK